MSGQAGVVDEAGHGPQLPPSRLEEIVDLVFARHVRLHRNGSPRAARRGRHDLFVSRTIVAVVDHDVVAAVKEPARSCGADAPAATGDDRDGSGPTLHQQIMIKRAAPARRAPSSGRDGSAVLRASSARPSGATSVPRRVIHGGSDPIGIACREATDPLRVVRLRSKRAYD